MFRENTDVVLSVTPVSNRTGFTPETVQMRVDGPTGPVCDWIVLTDISSSPVPGVSVNAIIANTGSVFTFSVAAIYNVIAEPATKEARLITLRLLNSSLPSPVVLNTEYLIVKASDETRPLTLMTDSFQSYPEALVYADSMPGLTSWQSASFEERVRAMQQAFFFLSRLQYEDNDDLESRAGWGLPFQDSIIDLYEYTAQEFLELDPAFIKAIRSAQIAEANARLGSDPMATMRDSGVTSHSVGDVSATFRAVAPLKLSVSREALRYLSGYVRYTTRLTRS